MSYAMALRPMTFSISSSSPDSHWLENSGSPLVPRLGVFPLRWYSVILAWRFWQDNWHTKLLMILFICVRLGCARSLDDILRPTASAQQAGQRALANGGEAPDPPGAASSLPASVAGAASPSGSGAGSGSGVGASSSSSSAPAPSAGATRATAIAEGRALLDSARAKSENTLHAVGRLMSDPDWTRQIDWVAYATMPFARDHSSLAHGLRSADMNMRQYSDWAVWASCGRSSGFRAN